MDPTNAVSLRFTVPLKDVTLLDDFESFLNTWDPCTAKPDHKFFTPEGLENIRAALRDATHREVCKKQWGTYLSTSFETLYGLASRNYSMFDKVAKDFRHWFREVIEFSQNTGLTPEPRDIFGLWVRTKQADGKFLANPFKELAYTVDLGKGHLPMHATSLRNVTSLSIHDSGDLTGLTDDHTAQIARLNSLRHLSLRGVTVPLSIGTVFKRCSLIESLSIVDPKNREIELPCLQSLEGLKDLVLRTPHAKFTFAPTSVTSLTVGCCYPWNMDSVESLTLAMKRAPTEKQAKSLRSMLAGYKNVTTCTIEGDANQAARILSLLPEAWIRGDGTEIESKYEPAVAIGELTDEALQLLEHQRTSGSITDFTRTLEYLYELGFDVGKEADWGYIDALVQCVPGKKKTDGDTLQRLMSMSSLVTGGNWTEYKERDEWGARVAIELGSTAARSEESEDTIIANVKNEEFPLDDRTRALICMGLLYTCDPNRIKTVYEKLGSPEEILLCKLTTNHNDSRYRERRALLEESLPEMHIL